ncbi:MAG: hypothetical protein A2133_09400 [Actinobacteria bacterium RBG_16_64_13]|nr:MAG: hypothetical protein A2133_09400 [Actinobacteria bacterium RBG_16_64_13]
MTRRWLLGGLLGFVVVLSFATFRDAWVVNQAGVLVNRAIVARTAADEPGRRASAASTATVTSTGNLTRAMALMETTALRAPHTSGREVPIWRTYGAAAALAPSEHAFQLLLDARDKNRLDRVGELWLGEVASATEHWDQAAEAYRRVDASNVLISRADAHLQAGEKTLAVRQYNLARISLEAAIERDTAERLLSGGGGGAGSTTARFLTSDAERVTALYRIGRGLLAGGQPRQAVPVLEQAMERAATASPGAVVEQSLNLNLAFALAQTLPAPPPRATASTRHSYYLDPPTEIYVSALVRVRTLVLRGTGSDRTASVCVQAARSLLLIGDDDQAVSLLHAALDLDPLLPDTYLVLGSWYETKGMKVLPFELYKKGAEQIPANLQIAVAYALASYKALPPDKALPVLERTARTETKDPYLFAFLGDCYLDMGMSTEARAAYEEGLRRAPLAEPLLQRLAALDEGVETAP